MIVSEEFKEFFLFKGLSDETLERIFEILSPEALSFSRGDLIYSPSLFEKKIGFILEGRCEVRHSHSDKSGVVINVLNPQDSFGVLAAFSENDFPTEVVAAKNSKVVFFNVNDVINLVRTNGEVAMNLINFLIGRIDFLNGKIITFSGTSVEQKLSSYILDESKSKGEIFDFNKKKAAEAISSGRASVYRALDSFVSAGMIRLDYKKIYILDRIGLERISK